MNGCIASACAATRPLVTAPACPPSKKTAASCRRGTVSCRATGSGGRDSDDGLLWLPARREVGPQYKEYAGTFAIVPGSGGGGTRQGKVSLCITNLLSDIEADGDSTVDVVIVPRTDAKVTLNVGPTIQYRE